jgi:hypothetical protein
MISTEISTLAEAWVAHSRAAEGSVARDSLSWVIDREWELVRKLPRDALRLILAILQRDSSIEILEVLSAGPLEDLLSYHGEAMIGMVEAEARSNATFACLLGGVWRNSMSESVWSRVQAVWDRRGWDGLPEV